jgi:hypothetical protein
MRLVPLAAGVVIKREVEVAVSQTYSVQKAINKATVNSIKAFKTLASQQALHFASSMRIV